MNGRAWVPLIQSVLLSTIACGGSETPTGPTPPVNQATVSATASASVGVQGATSFAFSAQPANFNPGALTYRWEFGDGETSSDTAPSHIYSASGTHNVVVSVSSGQQTARGEVSLTVYSVTGRWRSTGGTTTMELTHTGSTITGQASVETGPGEIPYTQCAITGSVVVGTPAVIILNQPPCRHVRFAQLVPSEYRLNMAVGGEILAGTRHTLAGSRPVDPIELRRQ